MATGNKKQLKSSKEIIKPKSLGPFNWKAYDSDDLLNADLPEPEFLVNHLFPKGGIAMISGDPESGKSWLALEITRCVSVGDPLFSKNNKSHELMARFATKETRVLYLDEESPFSQTRHRWKTMKPEYMSLVTFMCFQGIKIDDEKQVRVLLDIVISGKYGLVIFDSFIDFHSKNENESQQAQMLINFFREISKLGATVIILHHNRKESSTGSNDPSQTMRGSSAFRAGLDSHICITRSKLVKGVREMTIGHEKLKQGKKISPFRIDLMEKDDLMYFNYLGGTEEGTDKFQQAKEEILKIVAGSEKYYTEIVNIIKSKGIAKRTIQEAIAELTREKKITPKRKGKRVYYG